MNHREHEIVLRAINDVRRILGKDDKPGHRDEIHKQLHEPDEQQLLRLRLATIRELG